jgi:hypothetical protein
MHHLLASPRQVPIGHGHAVGRNAPRLQLRLTNRPGCPEFRQHAPGRPPRSRQRLLPSPQFASASGQPPTSCLPMLQHITPEHVAMLTKRCKKRTFAVHGESFPCCGTEAPDSGDGPGTYLLTASLGQFAADRFFSTLPSCSWASELASGLSR